MAAAEVLQAGGNAVDATVAAGFASAATEPGLSNLGGGGFLLAAPPDAPERVVDFFVDAPGRGRAAERLVPSVLPVTLRFAGADQVFHAGWGSVAVPGCLDGYLHAARTLGRLPLEQVVAPAVRLARGGARWRGRGCGAGTAARPAAGHPAIPGDESERPVVGPCGAVAGPCRCPAAPQQHP